MGGRRRGRGGTAGLAGALCTHFFEGWESG